MNDKHSQHILETLSEPATQCVDVIFPLLTSTGMTIRIGVTTTSFILHALDVIPDYQSEFISDVFHNPIQKILYMIVPAYNSCTHDA